MELPQLIILGVLLLMAVILAAKVYFLHRSAEEIAKAFHDIRTSDTNTLISVSSRDPYMRRIAADINLELRLLRKERRRCQQGDLELKEAVAGLSHDLRTPLTALIGYLDLLEQEENCWSEPFPLWHAGTPDGAAGCQEWAAPFKTFLKIKTHSFTPV